MIGFSEVAVGDLSSAVFNHREILKFAVLSNAAVIIIAHNHPKDSLGNRLKMELGDNEVGVIHNHKISWKNVTQRRVDTGRLKSEQPEIYSEYRTESHFRRLQVA